MITDLIQQVVECLQLLSASVEAMGPQHMAEGAQHPQDPAQCGFYIERSSRGLFISS